VEKLAEKPLERRVICDVCNRPAEVENIVMYDFLGRRNVPVCQKCDSMLGELYEKSAALRRPKRVTLYTTTTVDVAHMLPGYPGKCRRVHGHSMKYEIWVSGPVNETDGMLVDFKELREVANQFDHHFINDLVDFQPTAENLARFATTEIFEKFPCVETLKVRVHETGSSYAEVQLTRGEYETGL
jgi:6-pyruvoyltetrahydropterin/6-carboxytetrahydropterin synthase